MRQQLAQLGNGAHALATQMLGNPDDAADAVHDAIEKVLARPETYDANKGPFKPWFLRVVRNRCLDLLRRRRETDSQVDDLAHPEHGPERIVGQSQRAELIRITLRSLPRDKGEIIILRDYLDLSYAEIADALGIAQGTVMSRLHRARLALKEALEHHEQ